MRKDIPWLTHMSTPKSMPRDNGNGDADGLGTPVAEPPYNAPPTYAAFSSSNLSNAATAAKRRSTILVHQKSPLLLATPPQITRALAYSHPFLLPLNKLSGLLSWTTGDPWESFLLLVLFWAVVQYGDVVMRWAGPIAVVLGIIGGMYGRRYSPLSSSGWADHPSWATTKDKKKNAPGAASSGTGGAHQTNTSEVTSTRHQKTLDEIVDTLKVFTTRCNILLEPLLEMTDFLSTQRTATSATTRPALTTLFVRILAVTPIWFVLTLPPLRIITTKRVVMLFGTLVLSWHSRICQVSRTLLWRSATIREIARWVTGLEFEGPKKPTAGAGNKDEVEGKGRATADKKNKTSQVSALTTALKRSRSGKESGVRFTFIIYENQRRWVGLGWTNSLFAYERSAWTDEHNNAVPPRDQFELPEVEDGHAKWRWVKGSKWRVDGVGDVQDENEYEGESGKTGWIFYDNKWQNGRRGQDGWGRWTRRRKWYRDAELVEADEEEDENDNQNNNYKEKSAPPPPPALPSRPAQAQPIETSSNPEPSTSPSSNSNTDTNPRDDEDMDSVSVLSTSSKSTRFRFPSGGFSVGSGSSKVAPSLRRRTTGESRRSRRTSEVGSLHDGEGNLTPQLELEIQGSRKELDTWGVGDEVQMGLE
ncbi:integral peroxisomal membrane peroxin-domain-containing protein [Pseudomassariella vexata]|uniref:Integral peroxisomal membrane peroxin-domain-containing protein n=1 Tax=Pseudomassariella vexata TaxID=1141098 RepID=A0A1Y2DQP0_9PEZI|nr:integral peroxisomal membrane peroxin-domain-containing protein [Pseudomassariella vexata]ORY61489.1 integral peroxisomal membrane peroxin-domain-containing protein [Pseudomassariella vexata]